MLADALDGTLTAADQALFDAHLTHCGPCAQMLADARRGAAWLEMLRDPRPEPPAALLERILSQTSGAQTLGAPEASLTVSAPSLASEAWDARPLIPATPSPAGVKVLPFRARIAHSFSRTGTFGQVILQPRLAMTAAMAFFSIALTLNLTGVRLQDLRAADLRPSSLKRDFYSANARVVQYYEGLRVVYELESRVHDLQSTSDTETTPAATPAPAQPEPDAQPKTTPRPAKRPAPNPGTSRREGLTDSRRLAAANLPVASHAERAQA
jgi:hypothetical protein